MKARLSLPIKLSMPVQVSWIFSGTEEKVRFIAIQKLCLWKFALFWALAGVFIFSTFSFGQMKILLDQQLCSLFSQLWTGVPSSCSPSGTVYFCVNYSLHQFYLHSNLNKLHFIPYFQTATAVFTDFGRPLSSYSTHHRWIFGYIASWFKMV